MTTREQIIQTLDQPMQTEPFLENYDALRACIEPVSLSTTTVLAMDNWFRGVIESLYYKPNNYLLVLEGKHEIGKDRFFSHLLPEEIGYYVQCSPLIHKVLYEFLINNVDFEYQKQQKIIEQDNFIVLEENARNLIYPATDKRLCSYCTTTNKWRYPQRKNVIVLQVESIDWELYDSIDKLELWKEIFYCFKPKTIQ